MSFGDAVLLFFVVLILASCVFENRVWRWYVRACGGRPTRANERRAQTRRYDTWK